MNTEIHPKSPTNLWPEAAPEAARQAEVARETAQKATIAAKDATGAVEDTIKDTSRTLSFKVEEGVERTKEYAQHAIDATKEIYHSAALKAGDTLETSKEYVRRNPVPAVLGAIAFGAAIGYMLIMARRKPTFGERYADEPLVAVREAILGALAPVAQSVHKGYDSARDGAGKAMDQVHRFGTGRDSFSDQISRIGNNLKFW